MEVDCHEPIVPHELHTIVQDIAALATGQNNSGSSDSAMHDKGLC